MNDILNGAAIKGSVAALATLLLNACAPVDGAEKAGADAQRVLEDATTGTTAGKPTGAILIDDDLYAVPIAVDRDGCEQFKAWSETGAVPLGQPIYYHDGNGSFSSTRSEEASCNATMVEIGPDTEGCPTFRAEQPGGTATEARYFQSAGGYTTVKERSVCAS